MEDKEANVEHFAQSLNSYLGMMLQCRTYNIRKSVMYMIDKEWWKYVTFDGKCRKFMVKNRYKACYKMRMAVRSGEYADVLTPQI